MADPAAWSLRVSNEVVRDVERCIARIRAEGRTLEEITADDFRTPACQPLARAIHARLYGGAGFLMLKGLPVSELGDDASAMLFWGLGALFGEPLPQNAAGDRVYAVQDERTAGNGPVLTSKMNVALPWHTDSGSGGPARVVPEVFGLLAVHAPLRGGTSHIMSAHTLHNALLEHYPEQLERLFQEYYFDRALQTNADQEPFTRTPIFSWIGDMLAITYNRQRIERGHMIAGVPLTPEDEEALDCTDELLADPALALGFDFEPGDGLFMNNRTMLHNRDAFVDGESRDLRRLVYRIWIRPTQA
jgi:hypothetical protein